MSRNGQVARIHVAPENGESMRSRDRVEAVAGRGLRGDRYFEGKGIWNVLDEEAGTQEASDVTFIEIESLEAIERDYGVELDPGAHRRNITTSGVALNHLVGERFQVGGATCEGVGLCEPCGYLQALTAEDELADALTHRGGLDAAVIESGTIGVGDPIRR